MADRSVGYDNTIEEFFQTYNLTAQDVGDIAVLVTTATDLVAAVNEVHNERDALDTRVGALSSIDATVRGADVTNSVENVWSTLNTRVGPLATLSDDIEGASVVASINLLDVKFENFTGVGTALTTTATDLAGAVNEIESNHNALDTRVGPLATLSDDIEGANLVSSINLLDVKFENFTGIGTSLDTVAANLAGAVNEIESNHNALDTRVGALATLSDDIEGSSVVASINLLDVKFENFAGFGTALDTTATTLAGAVNELHTEIGTNDTDINSIRNAITGSTSSVSLAGLNNAIEGADLVTTLNTFYSAYATRTDVGTSLDTTATTLGAAINEIHGELNTVVSNVGSLGDLDAGFIGVNDDNVIAAINYVYGLQTGATQEFTNANLSGTLDVGGATTLASTLNVQGAFTSLGIDDNATANRLQIENGLVTVKTGLTVQGAVTASGALTATGLTLSSATGSISNGAGESVDFDADSVTLAASGVDIADFASSTITLYKALTSAQNITLTGSGTLSIAGSEVFHPGNMGSGSGLDAELFAGLSASSYARTDIAETFGSNVTINGNLTVNGTTTTVNTTELVVSDNIIVLNNDVTGAPSQNAGIEIERGTSANVLVRWNETSDVWEITENGSNYYRILTTNDTGAGNGLNADLLDSQEGTYYRNASNINAGTLDSARLPDLTVADFSAAAVQTGAEAFVDSNTVIMTAAAVQDKIESYGYTTNTGDITNVTAGSGLTGGGASGSVTLNIGAGTGITVNTNDIAVDLSVFSTTNLGEGTNLYYTTTRANAAIDARVTKAFVDALSVNAGTLGGQTSTYYRNATNINAGTLASARLPDLTVADFSAAAVQTGLEAFVDSDTVLMTAAAVQDKIESYGYSNASNINAGTLDSARLPDLVVADFSAAAVQTGAEAFVDSDTVLMTAAAVQDKIESYGYTANTGDITSVGAGNGLTGGGTSGAVTLNIGAGPGITVGSDTISIDLSTFSTTNLSEGSNLYYTTARANAAIDARVTKAFVDALNVDADTLDSLNSTQFLRSDAADTATGKITFEAGARFNDSDIIELGSSADAEIFHNGVNAYIDLNVGNLVVRDGVTTRFTFSKATGEFTATGDITAFSDPRLKTLESGISDSGSIIDNIVPYYYRWNEKAKAQGLDDERRRAGVMADDVERHYPEALSRETVGKEEYKKVNYEALIPVMMAELRSLRKRVKELEEN